MEKLIKSWITCNNVQLSESPTSPEDGDSEGEPRSSQCSDSKCRNVNFFKRRSKCRDSECPNIPKKRRNRPSKKVWGTTIMNDLRKELEGGMEDSPTDTETVRKAKQQLR